jgi:hypothetical protein
MDKVHHIVVSMHVMFSLQRKYYTQLLLPVVVRS